MRKRNLFPIKLLKDKFFLKTRIKPEGKCQVQLLSPTTLNGFTESKDSLLQQTNSNNSLIGFSFINSVCQPVYRFIITRFSLTNSYEFVFSDDGGISWNVLNVVNLQNIPYDINFIEPFDIFNVSGQNNNELVIITGANYQNQQPINKILYSTNYGNNFSVSTLSGSLENFNIILFYSISSVNLNNNQKRIVLVGQSAFGGGVVIYSDDNAITWNFLTVSSISSSIWAVVKTIGTRLLIAGFQKIIVSDDYGATWTETGNAFSTNTIWYECSVISNNNTSVIALLGIVSGSVKLILSTDSGNTWTQSTYSNQIYMKSITSVKASSGELFFAMLYDFNIGVKTNTCVYSIDGQNWTVVNNTNFISGNSLDKIVGVSVPTSNYKLLTCNISSNIKNVYYSS